MPVKKLNKEETIKKIRNEISIRQDLCILNETEFVKQNKRVCDILETCKFININPIYF